ncbi:MAG: DNA cytosine methyltransferase [Candidatus Paceibacterota bacterium]|jgi:DNA (cytosine-5)-methyltransferase 1|nr:DNA cytosine methyltransferase [Candidatus Paceibacterota bacterium]
MNSPKKPTYIDLFAGCGGLSLGLYRAGWHGLFAIEKDTMAFGTLKHNLIDKKEHFTWPDWLPQNELEIKDVLSKYKKELSELSGKVDLVVGGPPCQGFSMAGKRNEGDMRNKLIDSYIDFVKLVRPRMIFFENVKGFTVGFKKGEIRGDAYSKHVIKSLGDLGYNVDWKVLDFSEYGVPQRRKRFILVGVLGGDVNKFFELLNLNRKQFLSDNKLLQKCTLKAALSDLYQANGIVDSPDSKNFKAGIYSSPKSNYQKLMRSGGDIPKIPDSHRFAKHGEETVKLFQTLLKKAEKGKRIDGDERLKYGLKKRGITVLGEDLSSPTLTTHPDDYVHYLEPRILTVREYARIQSFPDWFEIRGKYTTGGKQRVKEVPRYTQLGNAIPPLFGEQAGRVLKKL